MDTKPLERFATQARRDLLSSVDARATAALAAGSVARAEWPEAVRKLEAEITAHGRAHVIDKVAYTWFNRIIALRFMDARGYTDAGVVSPAQGLAQGQPEILADAKRGNLDSDVVNNKTTADTIVGLLDGTRRSTDAESEAYALLLTEYCRHWHKSMPFMFEREGDYTELLVPTGLLADGAILSKARQALTEEVCEDVEVIGWLYQFYISERKDEVFAGFKKNKKAGADEIPAATQLFTPHWIVRYLVENSVGRLWMLNRPNSRLADQMDYYIAPVDEEPDFLKITRPEELTVIDPACGSGHMLTYAFDLLYAIYEEEGYAPSEIPSLILKHNLYGTEIDPRAGALAAFALAMKARAIQRTYFSKRIEPGICVIESISFDQEELNLLVDGVGESGEKAFWNQFADAATLGSLVNPDAALAARLAFKAPTWDDEEDIIKSDITKRASRVLMQAEVLSSRYSVVVANPPYMGANSMGTVLAAFAKATYPKSRSDLFAMFTERCIELAARFGYIAMITMQTWLFLSTYEGLRAQTLSKTSPVTLAHLGARAFDTISGEVVNTAAFVLTKAVPRTARAKFLRLGSYNSEATKNAAMLMQVKSPTDDANTFERTADFFRSLPGNPFAFWLDDSLSAAFQSDQSLKDVLRPKIGMRTGNNERFLRRWYEVSFRHIAQGSSDREAAQRTGLKWFPYNKGGGLRRWYGNQDFVVDWYDDGRDIKAETLLKYPQLSADNLGWKISNEPWYFKEGITWSDITTTGFAARYTPPGFIFDVKGSSGFATGAPFEVLLALLNSTITHEYMAALNPSTTFNVGDIAKIPFISPSPGDTEQIVANSRTLIEIARQDWDAQETSLGFCGPALLVVNETVRLDDWVTSVRAFWANRAKEAAALEERNEDLLRAAYHYSPTHQTVGFEALALDNVRLDRADLIVDLVSYAVGCMFGRYSLDRPGLFLADQGTTIHEYFEAIPSPRLRPDADNVIPFVDDGWFEDDIVERFREFLQVAFGKEHFEENLRFVEESLGVKTLRDYFITKAGKSRFYDDHVQRYKKRPIYWMFSSPKGSFNALVYMHRYNPSTVSTVLNEYLREYRAKLEVALANADRAGAAGSTRDQKEADRLRKVLAELGDYEHDVLYPLATQQIAIDLDDGVRANYPKFYPALRKIAGLEAAE